MVDRHLLFGVFVTILFVGSVVGLAYFIWDDYRQQQVRESQIDSLAREFAAETRDSETPSTDQSQGTISIYSVPSGAEVSLRGRPIGVTPVSDVSVSSSDSVHLRLQKDGHVPLDTVLVSAHEGTGIHLFSLDFAGEPGPDSLAGIDSLQRELSPARTELEADTARPALSAAAESLRRSTDRLAIDDSSVRAGPRSEGGVSAESEEVVPTVSETGTLQGEMPTESQDTGILQVLVQPWGSIYIDGELHEMDTDVVYTVEQAAGTHNIRVEHPALGTMTKSVNLADDTLFVEMDFESATLVSVTSEPVPAEIYLDGRAIGIETPARLNVPPGQHIVDVRSEGWTSVEGPQEVGAAEAAVDSLTFSLEQELEP